MQEPEEEVGGAGGLFGDDDGEAPGVLRQLFVVPRAAALLFGNCHDVLAVTIIDWITHACATPRIHTPRIHLQTGKLSAYHAARARQALAAVHHRQRVLTARGDGQ